MVNTPGPAYSSSTKNYYNPTTNSTEVVQGLTGAANSLLYAWSSSLLMPVLLTVDAGGNLNTTVAGGGGSSSVSITGPLGSRTSASAVSVVIASDQTTVPVSGSFYQATQPVSLASLPALSAGSNNIGHITVDNATLAVTGSFYQGTQPVSIASMPSTPVTGTFWQATQPVSGTVTFDNASLAVTGPLTDTQLRATPVPVSGAFYQATQPVSLTSIPLPSNAALETGGNLDSIDTSVTYNTDIFLTQSATLCSLLTEIKLLRQAFQDWSAQPEPRFDLTA